MGGVTSSDFIYSVPVSKKKQGETQIYRHPSYTKKLIESPEEGITTLQDIFVTAVKRYPQKKLLGKRDSAEGDYFWLSYDECLMFAQSLGSGIAHLGLRTSVNEFQNLEMNLVGVFAKNREEWLMLDYANFLYNNTMVPFYDTLGQESISFVLEQTNLEVIFCSAEGVESLLKCAKTHKLSTLVLLDPISPETTSKIINERQWKLYSYKEVIEVGKKNIQPFEKVTPDSVFTFSYTSGTTGNPKGVLLTHKNLVSVIATGTNEGFHHNDVYLSYLPLPHIMERLFVHNIMFYGGRIGFYFGNVAELKKDLAALKPTIFVSVPRLYTRFYDVIKSNLEKATGVKGKIAKRALASKMRKVQSTGKVTSKMWDSLVFKKSKEALGGKVRWAGTGSAPISGETLSFLKATLCTPIAEGYGQTESTGASFATNPMDPITGHVGGCRGNYEFKLVDIPELSYTSLDRNDEGMSTPRGEICIRGNGIFIGYYKEPEKTSEAIDEEGWLHTGDVGQLNVLNGSVKIIDRKKNIFKLQQGEYIAPEKIENIYVKAKGVAEVFVHGDSLQSQLVCVIVPDHKHLFDFARENSIEPNHDAAALCQNPAVKAHYLANVTKQGKIENLFGFEQAKAVYLEPKSFVDHECMTNTFKLKRNVASKLFAVQIKEMYETLAQAAQ